MKNQCKIMLMSTMLLSLLLFTGFNSYGQVEIQIQVSPSTLNLSNSGQWVTVHTDIAYGSVLAASVELDGVPIKWSKVDNQGNFVAKFVISDIKELFDGEGLIGTHELTLTGETIEGESFIGKYTITVINSIVPIGKS
jgi:hypothetical protein